MKFFGKHAYLVVGATTVHVTGWSITESESSRPATDTGSGGWIERVEGLKDANGSFDIDFDSDDNPFTVAAPNLEPGTFLGQSTVGPLTLHCDGVTTMASIALVKITEVTVKAEVEGGVVCTFNWEQRAPVVWTV